MKKINPQKLFITLLFIMIAVLFFAVFKYLFIIKEYEQKQEIFDVSAMREDDKATIYVDSDIDYTFKDVVKFTLHYNDNEPHTYIYNINSTALEDFENFPPKVIGDDSDIGRWILEEK